MKNNKTIRTLSAFILLLLFIVGNAPKQLMHNIFASHVDCKNGNKDNIAISHIKNLHFHCDVNHFVVEAPFVPAESTVIFSRLFHHLSFTPSFCSFIAMDFRLQFDLRGPPSI